MIPHTLRHTAISWYLRTGIPPHQVSDYGGVSEQSIRKDYKHHIRGGFNDVLVASNRLERTSKVLATGAMDRNKSKREVTKVQQNQPGDLLRRCRKFDPLTAHQASLWATQNGQAAG